MKKVKFFSKKKKQITIIAFLVLLITFTIGIVAVLIKNTENNETVFSDELPVIIIDSLNQDINEKVEMEEVKTEGGKKLLFPKSERFEAKLYLYENDPHKTNNFDEFSLKSNIIINTRGQSSLSYPKKQYTVRLVDDNNYTNPQPLLKMPAHDKWVLNGLYSDKSLIRNYLAYEMGRKTMEYSPKTRFVEVYLKEDKNQSQEDQYLGVYLLTEKIEKDVNRINISSNRDNYKDTSFIIARDKIKIGDDTFQSDWDTLEEDTIFINENYLKEKSLFTITYPSSRKLSDSDTTSIKKTINDFEYSLYSSKFKDRREGYNKHIHVKSFIDFALIQEITKNIDGGEVSSYLYKDLGEKIKAGPIWDFDMSLKNTNDKYFNNYAGFSMVDTIWFERLFQDETFAKMYENQYRMYRRNVFSDNSINMYIDDILLRLSSSAKRNSEKWYPEDSDEVFYSEVEKVRTFLLKRLAWLDENISSVKRITENYVE